MVVFTLPTSGRASRSRYPFRPRSISRCRDTGIHIELMNGARLWAMPGAPAAFVGADLKSDLTAIAANAIPMTGEQYGELCRAGQVLATRVQFHGRGPRARVEEQARKICEAIQPSQEQLARRNAEYRRRETLADGKGFNAALPYRVFNRTPQFSACFDFADLGEARQYLAGQLARRDSVISGAAPVGPDSNSQDPLESFIIWADGVETLADAPWHFVADGNRKWSVAYPTPAMGATRRDNVEYHQGRDAAATGAPESANPYSQIAGGDSRFDRWRLGWRESTQSELIALSEARTKELQDSAAATSIAQAREEGGRAAGIGYAKSANPFPAGTDAADAWDDGHGRHMAQWRARKREAIADQYGDEAADRV